MPLSPVGARPASRRGQCVHVSGPPRASARSHTSMRYPAAMWRGVRPDRVGLGANGPVWMKKWVKRFYHPLSGRPVSRCGAAGALSTCTPVMTRFLAAWGSRTSAWRAGRDRHVAQVLGPRALQSKFQGYLTPDEAAYHRNASQGRLWGGLLGRGSGLWPANTPSAPL